MKTAYVMKNIFLIFWGVWDWIYYRFNRMRYVSKKENLFRVVRKTYRGPDLQTRHGQMIKNGDQILKIHIYNYRLAKEVLKHQSHFSLAIYLKRQVDDSLKGLCMYIQTLPDQEEIKAIIGTSMLNRGAERMGFTTIDVEQTSYYKMKNLLYKMIYLLVHPAGLHYMKTHGDRLRSKHLVMSVDELYERYFSQEKYS